MWDESLPAYTGSFEDNIILFTLYFKAFLFYVLLLVGIITSIIIFCIPIFGCFLSYKSVVIKFKKDKKQHKQDKKRDKLKDNEQNQYLNILDKKMKKKKKHNSH